MDQNAIEAAVMRRFLQHLDTRKDVQNIDLMTLAGFCRNCLSKWYRAAAADLGQEVSDDDARQWAYGMSYGDWKAQYQQPSTDMQLALFQQQQALQGEMNDFRQSLESGQHAFQATLDLVEKWYDVTPCAFDNGLDEKKVQNEQGQNAGSLKVFALGRLNGFTPDQALKAFGEHYRDVLATPEGTDHQNIRQFMRYGWQGIHFHGAPMILKAVEAN